MLIGCLLSWFAGAADVVGRAVSPSAPAQPPSWAWETSRRNWTAYPAGRRTQTCPTPTRRPPPTARTHEGNAVPPPRSSSLPSFFFLPPSTPPTPPQSSSMSLAPPPSALSLHAVAKMQGEKEGCWGGEEGVGEQGWTHGFVSPSSLNSQYVPRLLFSISSISSPPGCYA